MPSRSAILVARSATCGGLAIHGENSMMFVGADYEASPPISFDKPTSNTPATGIPLSLHSSSSWRHW